MVVKISVISFHVGALRRLASAGIGRQQIDRPSHLPSASSRRWWALPLFVVLIIAARRRLVAIAARGLTAVLAAAPYSTASDFDVRSASILAVLGPTDRANHTGPRHRRAVPCSGQIEFKESHRLRMAKTGIGYMPQDFSARVH